MIAITEQTGFKEFQDRYQLKLKKNVARESHESDRISMDTHFYPLAVEMLVDFKCIGFIHSRPFA